MIIVMGSFRLPAENFAAAQPMMDKVVAATRAEDGCLLYAYSRDLTDPTLVRVSEKWRDRAALDLHFKADHMKTWGVERASLGLSERDIMVFESDDGVAV
ncbi:putative quinol monooxygenase [Novosphingobium sp. MMS21-SN21R]|uniref:putative quinol monooxygenase n=1 Tax=Novosphingobium sp. MMS21-SN21R TaxID=2969298 RepID=UPI0028858DE9|nr:putative quinol monooxygenase [Novosphingobium sp. MMS21-SN21R]MDT0507284.1 putative quinol monooxygenase [Novosphingobium sp. MMS21-SN21R]